LASKQYISPIRLFNYLAIDDGLTIAQIKKVINAEFAIAQSGFITIENQSYNKGDILTELEKENAFQNLAYHKEIWDNKIILNALEDATVDLDVLDNNLFKFASNPDKLAFLSPYYANCFKQVAHHLIHLPQWDYISTLMYTSRYILPEHKEYAYQPFRLHIEEIAKFFRNLSENNIYLFKKELELYLRQPLGKYLGTLPLEFEDQLDDICKDIINFTVAVQKIKPGIARAFSRQLTQVNNISSELQRLIASNDRAFSGKVKSEGANYWWVVWVVILVVRLLLNMNSCN
jgi:hypothetical protein